MFVDEAEIHIRAGRGGDGCVSFRREKYIPKGGPDGGDGGNAGSVYAVASPQINTLLDFAGRHHWKAGNGQPGMGKNMTGKDGADLTLELPPGTLIYDRDTGLLIKDLSDLNEPVCIAKGGTGGRGNAKFATPTHQTPREFEPGTAGEERWLRLELKLIADVGIVGLPNAGKSTLISRMSKARPKIADYPFTTLEPNLGIAELPGHRRLVLADLPGLIEGAHTGAGLGDTFLKHIERTRVILHLIDVGSDLQTHSPAEAYRVIRRELAKYSDDLARKPELVAVNKIDMFAERSTIAALAEEIGAEVLAISGVSGEGVPELAEALWRLVGHMEENNEPPAPHRIPPHRKPT